MLTNMVGPVTILDAEILTIAQVLTPGECASLIERAEALGFRAASVRTKSGPKMLTNIRNNDRVNLEDAELAALMWQRVAEFLPTFDGEHPCGVDSALRFYRYIPGQQFHRHKDGSVTNAAGHTSKLSYLIYLNDNCAGGETLFSDYEPSESGLKKYELAVRPALGMALLFRHARWHEGTPVTSGTKYVLRTDVFYSPEFKVS